MGQRREPRISKRLEVRIFGTDSSGKIFSQVVHTVDVSRHGARVYGVHSPVKVGETVGLSFGENKGHFRVQWVGSINTPTANHVGLLNLNHERPLWDMQFPEAPDTFNFAKRDRRQSPRVKCAISIELCSSAAATMRARASDLSMGGCFVEMPSPLAIGTQLQLVLWLGNTKLRLEGEVASSAPGFGIGIRFLQISPENRNTLESYVADNFGLKLGPQS